MVSSKACVPAPGARLGTTTLKPVLVIDDDEGYRELLVLTLEDHCGPREVLGFPAARPLLDHLARPGGESPALVLLDLHMPGMSGLQLMEQIRKVDAHVPLAVLSGAAAPEERAACLAAGAFAFLHKPVAYGDLVAALTDLVRKVDAAEPADTRPPCPL